MKKAPEDATPPRKAGEKARAGEDPARRFAVEASVTGSHGARVHVVFEDAGKSVRLDLSPDQARHVAARLASTAAMADCMEDFRAVLMDTDLGEDALPPGAVRKILHAMAMARNKMARNKMAGNEAEAEG